MSKLKRYSPSVPHRLTRLLITLIFGGCVTPVDLGTEQLGGRIVLSGQISTLSDQNIIQLGTTADTDRLPFPVSGATIWGIDDTSGDSVLYSEDQFIAGTYRAPEFSASGGHSYHVAATLPDGRLYLSHSEKVPDRSGTIESTYDVDFEQYVDFEGTVSTQPFMRVYVSGSVPETEETSFLRWRTEEAFILSPTDFPDPFGNVPPPCFVVQNADPQRVSLYNGEVLRVNTFENILICKRVIDWSFLERHYFTSYQSAVSKQAFDYWSKVNILANQVGSIFDTPPAEIRGNLYSAASPDEKVYGYFQATNQAFTRFVIFPSDLPFRLTVTTCTYASDRSEYPARCLDCLSARNSTYNRPPWF